MSYLESRNQRKSRTGPGKPGFCTALSLPRASLCSHPDLNQGLGPDDLSEAEPASLNPVILKLPPTMLGRCHFAQKRVALASLSGPTKVDSSPLSTADYIHKQLGASCDSEPPLSERSTRITALPLLG